MAAANQIVSQPMIRWEIVPPLPSTPGLDAADTHCCICLEEDKNSPILGHADPNRLSEKVHRVHKECLLQTNQPFCPTCRAPYRFSELPITKMEKLKVIFFRAQGYLQNLNWRRVLATAAVGSAVLLSSSFSLSFLLSYHFGLEVVRSNIGLAYCIRQVIQQELLGFMVGGVIPLLIIPTEFIKNRIIPKISMNYPSLKKAILIGFTVLSFACSFWMLFKAVDWRVRSFQKGLSLEGSAFFEALAQGNGWPPGNISPLVRLEAIFTYFKMTNFIIGLCLSVIPVQILSQLISFQMQWFAIRRGRW